MGSDPFQPLRWYLYSCSPLAHPLGVPDGLWGDRFAGTSQGGTMVSFSAGSVWVIGVPLLVIVTVLLCVCGDELRITKLQFLGKSALKQNVSKRIVRMRKIFKSECLERQTKDNKKKLKPVNNEYRYYKQTHVNITVLSIVWETKCLGCWSTWQQLLWGWAENILWMRTNIQNGFLLSRMFTRNWNSEKSPESRALAEGRLPKPKVIQLLGTMAKDLSAIWGVFGTAWVHCTFSSRLMKMLKRSDMSVYRQRGQLFSFLTENALQATSFSLK